VVPLGNKNAKLDINAYLRAVAPLGRETEQVGPFLATCTNATDNRYLNYAVPDDGAAPSIDETIALIDWYENRHRLPRLEYDTATAPLVEPALMAAGFRDEGRLPVLLFDDRTPRMPEPDRICFRPPLTDQDTRGMLEVQAEAYGGERPSDDDVRRRRTQTDFQSRSLIAEDIELGLVVGAGSTAPIVAGVTEIAAIGVLPAYRRRGIATAMANHLALDACARGAAAPFLMAAHDQERRIYQRAGFTDIGEILHISLPR
jgi:ribosomal protein S18 acetylase RimI-like enzyme